MFNTVLIANRGEIACRAIRTLKRLGITSVAVYSDADKNAEHVKQADIALALGGEKASDSYLKIDKIIAAAHESGAQAIWPDTVFSPKACRLPTPVNRRELSLSAPPRSNWRVWLKHRARELAQKPVYQ
jgi:urea carboxylase